MNTARHHRPLLGLIAALGLLGAAGAAQAAATTTVVTPSGYTAPTNGFITMGSAPSAAGGPVRHLWVSDHLQGTCRVDPDLDSPGPYLINAATCSGGIPVPITGPAAYDPSTNYVYMADEVGRNNQGIIRMLFNPNLDGGHGALVASTQVALGGAGSCGFGVNRPSAAAIGPDGNLYLSVIRTGNVYRVVDPAAANVPCGSIEAIGTVPDGRRGLGLAWVGHHLFGLDGVGPWQMLDADKCFTVANGKVPCAATAAFDGATLLPAGIASDQAVAPRAAAGTTLYIGDVNAVIKITQPASDAPIIEPEWSLGERNASSITVDPLLAPMVVYVADDRTAGAQTLQGKLFRVVEQIVAAPPSEPTNVSAVRGDASAQVSWSASRPNGSIISQYTVHSQLIDGTPGPDQIVPNNGQTSPATSVRVTGLQNGMTYTFTVDATNATGTSLPSAPSNPVTPEPAVVPSPPLNVSAIPGDSTVQVAWGTPVSDGGSALLEYIVTTSNNGTPIEQHVPANLNGSLVGGLQNGASYSFQVIAVNAVGRSQPSEPSAPVTPRVGNADLRVSMSGPATVNAGSPAAYTVTVSNVGTRTLPAVRLIGTMPASGGSAGTSSGTCRVVGVSLDCNLGPFALGASATVTLSIPSLQSQGTASVAADSYDAQGNLLVDVNPSDNSAAVTTTIFNPPPTSTTDLQVTGRATFLRLVNSAATFSFTITNRGPAVANLVHFEAPLDPGLRFNSVTSSSTGLSCVSSVPAGSSGGTVTCNGTTLANRGTVTVNISATPTVTGTISTTGTVSFSGTDPKLTNNSVAVGIRVR